MQEQGSPRIAVIGHVEHVTIAPLARLPSPGEIAHVDQPVTIPGGGGGIAFFQLTRSPGELHLFTAVGNDDAGAFVRDEVEKTKARIHAVERPAPHTRDVVLVTRLRRERTIFVLGEPLHPLLTDPLPWELLPSFDAVYFTAQDPAILRAARAARLLVVTARRAEALARSGARADVVVGSRLDAREASAFADFAVPPRALVMTEGERGGTIETAEGVRRFVAAPMQGVRQGAYGAGDSFAGALTWYLALGRSVDDACGRAALHGAAVLRGLSPLDHQLPLEAP